MIENRLRELRRRFFQELPDRLEAIRGFWVAALDDADEEASATALKHHVHSLVGAAGTFGFDSLGAGARALEELLTPLSGPDRSLDEETVKQVSRLLDEIMTEIAQADSDSEDISLFNGFPFVRRGYRGSTVFVVEDEDALAEEIRAQLAYYGYDAIVFKNPEEAGARAATQPPALIMLDIMFDAGLDAGLDLAKRMREENADIPIMALTARADFDARLKAVRAHVDAYVVKPIDMSELIDQIDQLCGSVEKDPYRVLVVDDSPSLSAFFSEVLERAGIRTKMVNDPLFTLDEIAEFRPELILMDVYMPLCSGIELAAIIRQQASSLGTPIVFLSSETSLDHQINALKAGGDEFLTKPILPEHLVTVCLSRLTRARETRRLITQDSLTGALNHTAGTEHLNTEMVRTAREGQVLSAAMIDIDDFKSINDRFGHPTGDRVIRTLARLLRQRLRRSDAVSRYGGEEFLVILPDTDADSARAILDETRVEFSKIRFQHTAGVFTSTFSGGVGDTSSNRSASALTKAADDALYRAKRSGKNRLCGS
ncbi:MAG: response regulator [Proteobacteria bacterium]|nr:MAG: response regulator [Pseudomonadota bacterium]